MPPNSLVYDPYFAALGGGELYACVLAKELAQDGGATLLAPTPDLRPQLSSRFGLNLNEVSWQTCVAASHLEASKLSRHFDRFVCLTLGDPPLNQASTGILVVQFPWGSRPSNRVLSSYQAVICYSRYCQDWIRQRWGIDSAVLYPTYPEEITSKPNPLRKNLVISIGRFQADLNSKGYPALFATFFALCRDKMAGWEYHVIGGAGQSHRDRTYLAEIKRLAAKTRVKIFVDLPRTELLQQLAQAKLFWHGAGFDEPAAPERAEHFGISVVEAMSFGVVPLVYAAGGPTEIVEHGRSGFHWRTPMELGHLSINLARDEGLRQSLARQAAQTAARYTPARLRSEFRRLLGRIER